MNGRRLLVAAALALATACAPSAPEPDRDATRERFGAPVVPAPRDGSTRTADPCATFLSPAALDVLAFDPPGEPRVNALGVEGCIYREADGRRQVEIIVDLSNDLFIGAYQQRLLPIFEPTTVDGLPAVVTRAMATSISCTVFVGLGGTQAVLVDMTGEIGDDGAPNDVCGEALAVAEAVVSTLPPA